MYRLIFLSGKNKGKRLAVQQEKVLIGRDAECHILLTDDDEVSRKHALLEQRADGVYLTDVGAMNRTLVNDAEVREARLQHDDTLQLGHTRILYQVVQAAEAKATRTHGSLQSLTFFSIALIIVLELLILAALFFWQDFFIAPEGEVGGALVAEVKPPAAPQATPAPAQTEPPAPAAAPPEVAQALAEIPDAMPAPVLAALPKPAAPRAPEVASDISETVGAEQPPPAALPEPEPARVPAPPPAAPAPVKEPAAPAAHPEARQAPVPAEVPAEPEPQPPAAGDALLARAGQMLKQAQAEQAHLNFIEADKTLQRIQIMAPDYLPAYVERARLAEKRGLLKKAGEQWAEVMERSVNTPLYAEAAAERQRLARTEMLQNMRAQKKQPDEEAAPANAARLNILEADAQKMPVSGELEELRILRIKLKAKPGPREIDGDEVRVVVHFFDQDGKTSAVGISRATVPGPVRLEGLLRSSDTREITVAYAVPRGFRKQEELKYGEKRRFYGYTVRVFLQDELQDQKSKPANLLSLPVPPVKD